MNTAGACGGPIMRASIQNPFLMARWLRNKKSTDPEILHRHRFARQLQTAEPGQNRATDLNASR
jgi:hypothetical protein